MAKYIYLMNDSDAETKELAERLNGTAFQQPSEYSKSIIYGGKVDRIADFRNEEHEPIDPVTDSISIMAHGTSELAITVKNGDPKRWTVAELALKLVGRDLIRRSAPSNSLCAVPLRR